MLVGGIDDPLSSSNFQPMNHRLIRFLLGVAALVAAAGGLRAQYDKDGRYVPSPNGVPSDPYAQPIPVYPGTPGQAIGTPSLPRAALPPPQTVAPLATPPVRTYPGESLPRPRLEPLTAAHCRAGWHASSGLSQRQFNRRCDALLDR